VKIARSSNGTAVSGATVGVYMADKYNSTTTKSCVTASDGRCTVSWTVSDSRAPVLAYVYTVSSNPAWDQTAQYIYLEHP
jgi:hypothetical protein